MTHLSAVSPCPSPPQRKHEKAGISVDTPILGIRFMSRISTLTSERVPQPPTVMTSTVMADQAQASPTAAARGPSRGALCSCKGVTAWMALGAPPRGLT